MTDMSILCLVFNVILNIAAVVSVVATSVAIHIHLSKTYIRPYWNKVVLYVYSHVAVLWIVSRAMIQARVYTGCS